MPYGLILNPATYAPQSALPVHDGDERPLGDFEATLDSAELLKVALRDEHSLLTQYKMITWGRIFTPIQVRLRARRT